MKYLYRGVDYIASVYDEIQDDIINEVYPDTVVYNQKFENPMMENGKLRERTDKEVKYIVTLKEDKIDSYEVYINQEILSNQVLIEKSKFDTEKIKYYELKNEKLVLNSKFFEEDRKKELIEKYLIEIDNIKNKIIENGFEFRDGLVQKMRDTDLTKVNSTLNAMQTAREMGQTIPSVGWQFSLKDGSYKFVDITEVDLKQMLLIGSVFMQKAFGSEKILKHNILEMSLEQLESVNLEEEFGKILASLKEVN